RTCFVSGAPYLTPDLLIPRDLSLCPRYTFDTDDFKDPDSIASNIYAQVTVNGQLVAAVIDSGCHKSVLLGSVFDALPDTLPVIKTKIALTDGSGASAYRIRGTSRVSVSIAGMTADLNVAVCDHFFAQCILGLDFLVPNKICLNSEKLSVDSPLGSTPFR